MTRGSLAHSIPKIHLHCHLEGTLRASTFLELAAKHGVPLRYDPSSKLADARFALGDKGRFPSADRAYDFKGFDEFLYLFAAVSRALKDPQDYARLAREFVEDALAQGVIYGELFVSPPVWRFFNPTIDVRATVEAIVVELRQARPRATFRLLPDLTRNFGADNALQTARVVAAMTDLDVIGVSLGGNEQGFPPKLFVEAFAYARSEGLHRVAHAGESGDAASVRDAVELLGAERIGHGIAALRDRAVVDLLAARRIPLEICPTSNRLTGSALADHPAPYEGFDRLGCMVTIYADDPALFKTSIEREYALVEATAGAATLERFVRSAVEASFALPDEKEAMRARIDAALAELGQQSRS